MGDVILIWSILRAQHVYAVSRNTKEVMECKRELLCEMHYAEDDIEYTKTGIKTPRLQTLPTMNLPLKSHEDTKVERELPVFRIVTTETDDVEGKEVFVYKDLDELHKRVQKRNWITEKWYTTTILDRVGHGTNYIQRKKYHKSNDFTDM